MPPEERLLRAIFGEKTGTVISTIDGVSLGEAVKRALDSIPNLRMRRVIVLRFGLEDGRWRTLEEVGWEFSVTRERIRQIEAQALRKLRHHTRSRSLKWYLSTYYIKRGNYAPN